MQGIVDEERQRDHPHPPLRPQGCDGTPLSWVLLLLADVPASTRRRACNPGPSRSQQTSSVLWNGALRAESGPTRVLQAMISFRIRPPMSVSRWKRPACR